MHTPEQGSTRKDYESIEISRRHFIATSGGGALAMAATTIAAQPAMAPISSPRRLIDTNVSLFRWPFRSLVYDETPRLVKKLRESGVTYAWAGSFEGLLHKDLRTVNARLAVECRQADRGRLVPFGSINPKLPDWQEDMRVCAEAHKMPGVRLHPNYHGYRLDDPAFAEVMSLATRLGLVVQIVVHMEDERMMHPLVRIEPVKVDPLVALLPRWKLTPVVLLNALNVVSSDQVAELSLAGNIYVDIAMLEGIGGLNRLLTTVPHSQVLFGSHSPLYYFESAALKLDESTLGATARSAICFENARRLVPFPGENA
jgi:predicted TIM-barrel fold metal-dependent hydrolase